MAEKPFIPHPLDRAPGKVVLPSFVQDWKEVPDEDARSVLRSIILSRAIQPTCPPQILALAWTMLASKQGSDQNDLTALSADEIKKKIATLLK